MTAEPEDTMCSRSPELLDRSRSQLLIVDIQEKLTPAIVGMPALLESTLLLLNSATVLNVPVAVSEQYPKGLGATIAPVRSHAAVSHRFEKLRFSAAEGWCDLNNVSPLSAPDAAEVRDQIVVAGIETHICVLQTAMDLLAKGFRVYVVADAVGCRSPDDQQTALRRMRDSGVVLCSAESVAFEWCEVAGSEQFKAISRLVRDRDSARRNQ